MSSEIGSMGMGRRKLGRTGLWIPRLGFGGLGVVDRYLRRWGDDGPLAAKRVINVAFENGIRLFETARWYGNNEARIGAALCDHRSECVFVSKAMQRDETGARTDVDESLRALLTDYIDVYLVHHVQWEDELQAVLRPGGALEGLRQAQAEGKIGYVGIAGHRPELLCAALETDEFDVVEVPCNVLDPWIFQRVLPVAQEFDVGVIAMKAIAGGQLSEHAVAGLRFALGQPSDCLVVGMSTIEQVQIGVTETISFVQMDEAQQRWLVEKTLFLASPLCRLECGDLCTSLCPHVIPIPDVLRLERYRAVYKSGHWAKESYQGMGRPAAACRTCAGHCAEGCPFQLPVRHMLLNAHDALSSPVTDYEIAQHGGKGAMAQEIAP
jgi:predicted aldo/keto reductase-like oxidoreductase